MAAATITTSISHTPRGALRIEIDAACSSCRHAHPTDREAWSEIIRAALTWLADKSPECRRFAGVPAWARGLSPISALAAEPPQVSHGAPPRTITAGVNPTPTVWTRDLPAAPEPEPEVEPEREPEPDLGRDTTPGTSEPSRAARSAFPQRTPKPIRSFLGCTTCKQRKVKCDEKRPVCGNCKRKAGRRCVYAYQLAPASGSRPGGGPDGASSRALSRVVESDAESRSRADSQAPEREPERERARTSSAAAVDMPMASEQGAAVPVLSPPSPSPFGRGPASGTAIPPHGGSIPSVSSASAASPLSAMLPTSGDASLHAAQSVRFTRQAAADFHLMPPQSDTSGDWLTRCVATHGMTWFIDASEVMDQQLLASQQRKTLPVTRQAVLDSCWETYIGYQGTVPLVLSDVSDMPRAALLYAFVATGAAHYAYWARMRKMPHEEHLHGARAMVQLAFEAASALIAAGRGAPEFEARLLMTTYILIHATAILADPRSLAIIEFSKAIIQRNGGPAAVLDKLGRTSAVDAANIAIGEAIQCLLRGQPTELTANGDVEWIDAIPDIDRLIPENWGFSPRTVRLLVDAISILYGPAETRRGGGQLRRLKSLHQTLSTTSLVSTCASPQPPRVQAGDHLWRQTLFCLVYIDGFQMRADDTQVALASSAILELFSEALAQGIYTVRWLVPAIVGGCLCAPAQRESVLAVFDSMAHTCGLEDVFVAQRLVEEVWRRRDAGEEDWRWDRVMGEHKEMDVSYT